jgi:hypothetical protein
VKQVTGGVVETIDLFSVDGVKAEPFFIRRRGRCREYGLIRVGLFYTSTNVEDKVDVGRSWIFGEFREYAGSMGRRMEEVFSVEVDMPVKVPVRHGNGEQPFYPKGLQGAWDRVEDICKEVDFGKYEELDFLFVISVESDFSDKVSGYDAPNVVVYELRTGVWGASRGRGPYGEEELLSLVRLSGFEDEEGLWGKVTYGKMMRSRYGVSARNWIGVVDIEGRERCEFVSEAFSVIRINFGLLLLRGMLG